MIDVTGYRKLIPFTSVEDMAEEGRAAIQQAIKQQGEIVRKLKADKAEKDKVRKMDSYYLILRLRNDFSF